VSTPQDIRGGSVPPRPPVGKPQQWFVLRPWIFDVTLAGVLLRATPRPPVPIPVADWARAYGLARDLAIGRHAISLIGPGPDFNPDYAMTTYPDEPVILATLAGPGGEPGGPAADRRLPPPLQGRRDRPGGNPGLRPLRRRDPADPQRRGPRPAPPGSPRAPRNTRTTATEANPDADRNHHENQHPARRR
jgi:hypothetical protein